MTIAALVLGALACLALSTALWLLARAKSQQTRHAIDDTLQRNLQIRREMEIGLPMPESGALLMAPGSAPQIAPPGALRSWLDSLGYSAWNVPAGVLVLLAAAGVLAALVTTLQANIATGAMVMGMYALLCGFGIWLRLNKRRQKVLSQLPGFLDNMVRLISIGNSPHAAFQISSGNVPEPLGASVRDAAASLSVSPDLGQAMQQLERSWGLPEFGLVAAVFRMSTRYGGRADVVLERVSAYIRDRQSAERELHALSTEVRLSAWILALLPIVVGGLIMVLNQGYFMRMWDDPTGRKMIFVAAALQLIGSFVLYRLARLK